MVITVDPDVVISRDQFRASVVVSAGPKDQYGRQPAWGGKLEMIFDLSPEDPVGDHLGSRSGGFKGVDC